MAQSIDVSVTFHAMTDRQRNRVATPTIEGLRDDLDKLLDRAGSGLDPAAREYKIRGGHIVGHRGPGPAYRVSLSRVADVTNPAYDRATGVRRTEALAPTEGLEHRAFVRIRDDGVVAMMRPSGAPTQKQLAGYIQHKAVGTRGFVYVKDLIRQDMLEALNRYGHLTKAKLRLSGDTAVALANTDTPATKVPLAVLEAVGGNDIMLELRSDDHFARRNGQKLLTSARSIFSASQEAGVKLTAFELQGIDAASGSSTTLNLLSAALTERVTVSASLDDHRMIDETDAWTKLDEALEEWDERIEDALRHPLNVR